MRLAEGEEPRDRPGRTDACHPHQQGNRAHTASFRCRRTNRASRRNTACAVNLSASAINQKGLILLNVVTARDFDYKPAIAVGRRVTAVSVDRRGDTLVPGWTPEGDVIAMHDLMRSELWRFSQVAKK